MQKFLSSKIEDTRIWPKRESEIYVHKGKLRSIFYYARIRRQNGNANREQSIAICETNKIKDSKCDQMSFEQMDITQDININFIITEYIDQYEVERKMLRQLSTTASSNEHNITASCIVMTGICAT